MEQQLIVEDLKRQIYSFWGNTYLQECKELHIYVARAVDRVNKALKASNNKYFEIYGFSKYNSVHYTIFLYFLSHEIGISAKENEKLIVIADQIYYLNKIMNGVDWYWGIELPEYIMCEHPIGSVLGRAKYGNYFCVYQGCTVGGSRREGKVCYPVLGDKVLMYANSSIIGECNIGNNVVVAADAKIINRNVPDNSIVFGTADNLKIESLTRIKKEEFIGAIWKD